MNWDDAMDEILIRQWDETGSLREVTNTLVQAGYAVTKNAVSGRRHRLPPEAFKRQTSAYAIQVAIPRSERPPRIRPGPERVVVRMNVIRKPSETAINLSEHKGVDYLANPSWGCKAIMDGRSEDGWKLQMVCGLRRHGDSPYCKGHLKQYRNPDTRRGAA